MNRFDQYEESNIPGEKRLHLVHPSSQISVQKFNLHLKESDILDFLSKAQTY